MAPERSPLTVAYDPERDVVTVNGRPFSGQFFRHLERPDPTKRYRFTLDGAATTVEEVPAGRSFGAQGQDWCARFAAEQREHATGARELAAHCTNDAFRLEYLTVATRAEELATTAERMHADMATLMQEYPAGCYGEMISPAALAHIQEQRIRCSTERHEAARNLWSWVRSWHLKRETEAQGVAHA